SPPPPPPLFPYTTLFRSSPSRSPVRGFRVVADTEYPKIVGRRRRSSLAMVVLPPPEGAASTTTRGVTPGSRAALETSRARLSSRSEEHTSELQSPDHLVC